MERGKSACTSGALLLVLGLTAGLAICVRLHSVAAAFLAPATIPAGTYVASGGSGSMPLVGGTGSKGISAGTYVASGGNGSMPLVGGTGSKGISAGTYVASGGHGSIPLVGGTNSKGISASTYVASGGNGSMPLVGGTGAKGVSVRFVNAGLGTTGTHGVHHWYCYNNRWPACHWEWCCNVGNVSSEQWGLQLELIRLYKHARNDCVENKSRAEDCRTEVVLPAVRNQLYQVLSSGIVGLSDLPYPRLLPEIMRVAPDTRVLLTQRDPAEWAQKRMADHPPEVMCDRGAGWNGSCFDIMNCCRPSHHTFLFECWTLTYPEKAKQEDGAERREALRVLEMCMIGHNRLVEGLVPKHQLTRVNAFVGRKLPKQLDRAIRPRS